MHRRSRFRSTQQPTKWVVWCAETVRAKVRSLSVGYSLLPAAARSLPLGSRAYPAPPRLRCRPVARLLVAPRPADQAGASPRCRLPARLAPRGPRIPPYPPDRAIPLLLTWKNGPRDPPSKKRATEIAMRIIIIRGPSTKRARSVSAHCAVHVSECSLTGGRGFAVCLFLFGTLLQASDKILI